MGPDCLTHGNPIPEAHAPNPFVYLGCYTNGTEESSWDASSCRGVRVCACRMIGHIGLWRALNSLQYRLHRPRGNWNWQAWQLLELLYCKCSTLLQDLQARLTILFFPQRRLCKVAAAHRVPQNPICSKSLLRAALFFTSPIINWKMSKDFWCINLAWDGSWPFKAPRTWSKLRGPQQAMQPADVHIRIHHLPLSNPQNTCAHIKHIKIPWLAYALTNRCTAAEIESMIVGKIHSILCTSKGSRV